MHLDDFDYSLPESLIAQYPLPSRSAARMLALDHGAAAPRDLRITDLPKLLRPGDLVIVNDTRVIPARLRGRKATGGAVEILIERVLDEHSALAHVRASKAPPAGSHLYVEPGGELRVVGREEDLYILTVCGGQTLAALLEQSGQVPLPPYVARPAETLDVERYQTIFADKPGAVAAPTAGLHFDAELLAAVEAATRSPIAHVTLHVGAGTFRPIRDNDLDAHVMHAEHMQVTSELCLAVAAACARGGRVIAIGTTVMRALEAAAQATGELAPFCGDTRLFIRPGFTFRVVDALVTNFHIPRSTLLMLVCAFAGYRKTLDAYRYAVAQNYRFFSYGDAMWLEKEPAPMASSSPQ